ncbi:ABC-F family ATP-binding cassette domain-containing protein [Pseudonocardia eucalypti]|uniref:ABC-F family ATP-binding cassette domain-containing protein n=1 Tax=Pseudonocardia eucalypti TaxID=648755 RepID=A0ABP9PSF3_9PSEU
MPNLINFESVTAHVPGDAARVLLDRVSLGVAAGDRIGVVGLNGGGKTTLLEVLTGTREPDGGRVSRQRDLRIAVVTQNTELPAGARVRDVVLGRRATGAEHEWAADPQVREVLAGLEITERSGRGTSIGTERSGRGTSIGTERSGRGTSIGTERSGRGTSIGTDLERSVDGMSGGERRRVALAAALIGSADGEADLVVLDEPTNHLDVEGIAWLAEYLVNRRRAVVVVTHDRWFLDAVCDRTWEVANGRVEAYTGGYADWVYARAERARQADAAEERRRNLARKELAWLRRGAPARTSKPRFRIEAAEALIAAEPDPRNAPELMAFASARLGKTVLELEDASLRVAGRELLNGVTWRLGPGDRIGLVGVNGSGKTTLLRALAGERALDGGRLVTGKTVRLAHLTQELRDVPGELRVLEAVEQVANYVRLGRDEMSASSVLERLGFPASRQWTPVAELSGGERRRLQLTRLLMDEPNVLLLDEPTNDLDIDTLQRLEDLLDGWPGTMVVVSHDRYLIERVCDTVVALFGDGRITHLPGGIEEYLARNALAKRAPSSAPAGDRARRASPGAADSPAPVTPSGAKPGARPSPAPPGTSAAARRDAQKEARRLERRLEVLADRETALHKALAEAATEPAKLLELDAELRALVSERATVEEEWLLAAETAEG